MRSFFRIIEGAFCCLAAVMRTVVLATAGEMPAGCGKGEVVRLVPVSGRMGVDTCVLERHDAPVLDSSGQCLLNFDPPVVRVLGPAEGLPYDHELSMVPTVLV